MKISIITVFPELYEQFLKTSLIARAIENNIISVNLIKFSDFTLPGKRIDEPVAGPGTGMLIKPDIIEETIKYSEKTWGPGYKVFFSPQGKKLDQYFLKNFVKEFLPFVRPGVEPVLSEVEGSNRSEHISHLILVCPRYEGLDTRVEEYFADQVISIGDYVLMGADLPAQVFLEGLLRLIPGIVGKWESVEQDSFYGSFLDYPEYGLPVEWKNLQIPEVVRSGNHAEIEKWRKFQAVKKTILKRFDWFLSSNPEENDIKLAKKFIPNHYVSILHSGVLVKDGTVGHSSIASLDIHDIARSCATYGVENYFILTQLQDQHNILQEFLDFWRSDVGHEYNPSRFYAVSKVIPVYNIEQIIEFIIEKEGKKPIIITTSAKDGDFIPDKYLDYNDQGLIFLQERPVLFLFGTGHGIAPEILQKSDYLLLPVKGMSSYNHLSVRSAAAVILDRWLGLKNKNKILNKTLVDK